MDARKKKLLSDLVMQTRDTLGPGHHYAALWVKHGGFIGDSYWVAYCERVAAAMVLMENERLVR